MGSLGKREDQEKKINDESGWGVGIRSKHKMLLKIAPFQSNLLYVAKTIGQILKQRRNKLH